MIITLSILGGVGATVLLPHLTPWIPYDYQVYVQGGRLIRAGLNPHAWLPYYYPLPITLFTTVLWSFLPDQFAWAFAFIPLGLLSFRYGKDAPLTWLFFPLLINVAYAQAEGWLLFPIFWLLEDAPVKSSVGMLALMFKPAYGIFIVPYRIVQWVRQRCWQNVAILAALGAIMLSAAFLVDPLWHLHFFDTVMQRSNIPAIRERDMTIWKFVELGGAWFIPLLLLLSALALLARAAWRNPQTRGHICVVLALFLFPSRLNPVSSMMVLPFAQSRREILALVGVSWAIAALEILIGGLGGLYLAIVLVALALVVRRNEMPPVNQAHTDFNIQ